MSLLLHTHLTWEMFETLLVVLAIIAVPFAVAGLIDDLIQKLADRREAERAAQAGEITSGTLSALGRTHEEVRAAGDARRRAREGAGRG